MLGLNDFQTLVLACIVTLILLIVTLFSAFGIRILWRRFKRRECKDQDGVLNKDDNSDTNARPLHSHLLNSDKMKCGDTHITIGTEDVEVCDETGTVNSGSLRGNNHSSTNGSIITMTLKNNHLIVETEERNDIQEDSRETTMKYSPSARDGVFVVEVQQGVRRSPGTGDNKSSSSKPKVVAGGGGTQGVSDQCALVHNPPDRFSDEETLEESDEKFYVETTSPNRGTPDSLLAKIKTGLTQSNPSLTSTPFNGASYCYGTQQGYDSGYYGYPIYNGYSNEEPPPAKPPIVIEDNINKPKITAAVFKNKQQPSIDVLQDGPLLSDFMLRERSQKIKDDAALHKEEEDPIQAEQNRLGNSAPGQDGKPIMNQIKQLLGNNESNKFEKLRNEVSPGDEGKPYENQGFEKC